jgi:hypothetical protein
MAEVDRSTLGDYSLLMPRPMGVWSAFKVQSSHFPGRAFFIPNPAKQHLSMVSECVAREQSPRCRQSLDPLRTIFFQVS